MWTKWNDQEPESGDKIAVAYPDGCSMTAGLVIDFDGNGTVDVLSAEDGFSLMRYPGQENPDYFNGSIWLKLPADYALAFTEETDADWR